MTMTLRAEAALDRSRLDHELPRAVSVTEVTRRYGRHDSAVVALAGVSIVPTDVLIGHLREDLDRAEHDQALSPAAANSLLNALPHGSAGP